MDTPDDPTGGPRRCAFSHRLFFSLAVPQSNIKFWHTVDLDDRDDNSVEEDDSSKEVESIVNVTCAAEGVYPEPTIRIYSESK